MTRRKGLVVVRCGDKSLHRSWLAEGRCWDLGVSSFSNNTEAKFPEAEYVHFFKGGKWDGLFAFFQAHPEALIKYDFFWLPDDDIQAEPTAVDNLFEIVERERFELAQPSLAAASYLSHLIVLTNPAFEHRLVNFVELMAPIVYADFLAKVLPLFPETRSGFGLDFIWQCFTTNPRDKVAIIDCVQVVHTRPVGGALHSMLRAEGKSDARAEQDVLLAKYGGKITTEATFAGRLKSGRQVHSRLAATLIAALGWMSRPFNNHGFTQRIGGARFIWWVCKHCLMSLRADAPQARPAPSVSRVPATEVPLRPAL